MLPSPTSTNADANTDASSNASAMANGNQLLTSEAVLVKLSHFEQRVVKFVENAQRTSSILATLPGKLAGEVGDDDDDDGANALEEIVKEQVEILAVR